MRQKNSGCAYFLLVAAAMGVGLARATQMEVLFLIESNTTGTGGSNDSNTIVFNESALANIILEGGIELQAAGIPTSNGTETILAPLALSPCTDNVTFLNDSTCQACLVCPVYTIAPCTLGANAVCDTSCPAGMRPFGWTCGLCPAGTYSPDRGSQTCSTCQPGYFASATGQSSYQACAAGTTTTYSTGFTECVQVNGPSPQSHIWACHSPHKIYI